MNSRTSRLLKAVARKKGLPPSGYRLLKHAWNSLPHTKRQRARQMFREVLAMPVKA